MSIASAQSSNIDAIQNNNSKITGAAEFDGKEISCIKEQDLKKIADNITIPQRQKEIFNTKILDRSAKTMTGMIKNLNPNQLNAIEKFENNQANTEAVLREFYALNPNSPKEDTGTQPIPTFAEAIGVNIDNINGDTIPFGEHGTEIQFVKMFDPTSTSGTCYQLVISGQLENCLQDIGKIYSKLADAGALIDLRTGRVEFQDNVYYLPPGDGTGLRGPSERSREAFAHMQDRSQNCPDVDILNNSGLRTTYQNAFSKFKDPNGIIKSDIAPIMDVYICVCKDRWELNPPPPPPPPPPAAPITKKEDPEPVVPPPAGPVAGPAAAIEATIPDLLNKNRTGMLQFRTTNFISKIEDTFKKITGEGRVAGKIDTSTPEGQKIQEDIKIILEDDSIIQANGYNTEFLSADHTHLNEMKEKYTNAIKNVVEYLQTHKNDTGAGDYEQTSQILTSWGKLITEWNRLAEDVRPSKYLAEDVKEDKRAQNKELGELENLKTGFDQFQTLKISKTNKMIVKNNLGMGNGGLHQQTKELLQKIPVGGEDVDLRNAIDTLVNKNPLESGEASKAEFQGARDVVLDHLDGTPGVPGNADRRAIVESWSNIMLGIMK